MQEGTPGVRFQWLGVCLHLHVGPGRGHRTFTVPVVGPSP